MNRNSFNYGAILMTPPHASAEIKGSTDYPDIRGFMRLYQTRNGVLISTDIKGLPYYPDSCKHRIYGYHIHDGNKCEGDMQDPFSHAMSHYNPNNCIHPFHAGDMPPLFGNQGHAFSAFLTDRFSLSDVIGKTVIIHGNPDDFTTQPAGNAGEKLACGDIISCRNRCK